MEVIQEGGGALKRQELKQSVSDKEILDSMRKLVCLLSIEACKPILVVTQNTIIKLKISIIVSFKKALVEEKHFVSYNKKDSCVIDN